MIYYKIRHRKTGLYSKGGYYVNSDGTHGWHKTGKTWDTLGKLRAHITTHLPTRNLSGTDMSDWEVVEYEVLEREAKSVVEVIDPKRIVQMLKN